MAGLILDTSGKQALLALTEGEAIVASSIMESGPGLSGRLFTELHRLLGSKVDQLSYIATGLGPGSFAGSRTSIVIAKTLAFSAQIPCIGFPSPLAFLPPCLEAGPFACLMDAKMGRLALLKGELPSFETTTIIFKKEELALHFSKDIPLISDLETPYPTHFPEPNASRIAKWAATSPQLNTLAIHYFS